MASIGIATPRWMEQAACTAPGVPIGVFEVGGRRVDTPEAALYYCGTCPCRAECLARSDEYEHTTQVTPYGESDMVYGGLTPLARMIIRHPEKAAGRYTRDCLLCGRRTCPPDIAAASPGTYPGHVARDRVFKKWCRACADRLRAEVPAGDVPDIAVWVGAVALPCSRCGNMMASPQNARKINSYISRGLCRPRWSGQKRCVTGKPTRRICMTCVRRELEQRKLGGTDE